MLKTEFGVYLVVVVCHVVAMTICGSYNSVYGVTCSDGFGWLEGFSNFMWELVFASTMMIFVPLIIYSALWIAPIRLLFCIFKKIK